jgi:hypothetical protein
MQGGELLENEDVFAHSIAIKGSAGIRSRAIESGPATNSSITNATAAATTTVARSCRLPDLTNLNDAITRAHVTRRKTNFRTTSKVNHGERIRSLILSRRLKEAT